MKKVIYIDMDDVLCNYKMAFSKAIKENPKIEYPKSQFDFFRKLMPIKDSIESVGFLMNQEIFDIYVLTAPSIYNPINYLEKRLWIEDYFGMKLVEKLIISPNKGLLKGSYLIDDLDKGRGQEQFEGKLLHFGTATFKDWKSIIHYFKINYSL